MRCACLRLASALRRALRRAALERLALVAVAFDTPPGACEAIQLRSVSPATRAYTPGLFGRAQPSPQLVAPTTAARRRGRAEHRPAGVALAGVDAALREAGADHRRRVEAAVYALAQYASVVIGTCASWSVSGVLPPSSVAPQPTIFSSVPALQSEASLAPDLRRRVDRVRDSLSSVMS